MALHPLQAALARARKARDAAMSELERLESAERDATRAETEATAEFERLENQIRDAAATIARGDQADIDALERDHATAVAGERRAKLRAEGIDRARAGAEHELARHEKAAADAFVALAQHVSDQLFEQLVEIEERRATLTAEIEHLARAARDTYAEAHGVDADPLRGGTVLQRRRGLIEDAVARARKLARRLDAAGLIRLELPADVQEGAA